MGQTLTNRNLQRIMKVDQIKSQLFKNRAKPRFVNIKRMA